MHEWGILIMKYVSISVIAILFMMLNSKNLYIECAQTSGMYRKGVERARTETAPGYVEVTGPNRPWPGADAAFLSLPPFLSLSDNC